MTRNISLDAIRGIAILLVILAHTVNSYGAPVHLAPLQLGGTGVDLFFVLSGWLIGSQIFQEISRFGNLDIKRFWIRRWMRTLPAYYTILIITIIQQYLTKENFQFPWQHLFFLQNYQEHLEIFYVSWSLSVEEQFYLLIAPFLVFLNGRSKVTQLTFILLLLALPSFLREMNWYQTTNETHVRIDCCVMGVLLAFIKYRLIGLWHAISKYASYAALAGLVTYTLAYIARYNPEVGISDPSFLILAFCFGSWVMFADLKSIKVPSQAQKLIMHISTRSYAMYLLHVDALVVTHKLLPGTHFVLYLIFALMLTILSSEILFRCVEKPFMDMRSKFDFAKSRTKLSNTREQSPC